MNNKFELIVFSSTKDVCNAASNIFIDSLNKNGKNTFIIPGGKTPRQFYQNLAQRVRDWNYVSLILSDERLVEEKSNQSNTKMVKSELLDHIKTDIKPDLVSVVNGYSPKQKKEILNSVNCQTIQLLPSKVTFLGIGSDGHSASLFPGIENENFNEKPFMLVDKPDENFQRISITLKVLSETPLLVFLVSGASKRSVINKLVNWPEELEHLPIHKIIQNAKGSVIVLCDQDASLN